MRKQLSDKQTVLLFLLYFAGYLLVHQAVLMPFARKTLPAAADTVSIIGMIVILCVSILIILPNVYEEMEDFRRRCCFILMTSMRNLTGMLIGWLAAARLIGADTAVNPAGSGVTASLVFGAVIFAPIMEEIIFRGCLFERIRRKTGNIISAVISSCIFALLHIMFMIPASQNIMILFFLIYTLMGIFLCRCAFRSRNLISSCIVHAAYNMLMTVLMTL